MELIIIDTSIVPMFSGSGSEWIEAASPSPMIA
ncbi:MAG: hypothetical protein DIAAKJNI_00485 [Candidatus Argoarchaeum ethanivorans]|uniref:Uncharacterized protein n=1 Tax=Candidatus Argoarchaeum ethanivorans TaxID=2608793 RepID=A0A811TFV4_9EURY|nr:MAG: hypothetical protein DIAAKJNI_00485 [Candidatus Argoarchaeum ethanivorans]